MYCIASEGSFKPLPNNTGPPAPPYGSVFDLVAYRANDIESKQSVPV